MRAASISGVSPSGSARSTSAPASSSSADQRGVRDQARFVYRRHAVAVGDVRIGPGHEQHAHELAIRQGARRRAAASTRRRRAGSHRRRRSAAGEPRRRRLAARRRASVAACAPVAPAASSDAKQEVLNHCRVIVAPFVRLEFQRRQRSGAGARRSTRAPSSKCAQPRRLRPASPACGRAAASTPCHTAPRRRPVFAMNSASLRRCHAT